MGIRIGSIALRNRVLLAPMSGVSDEPFRSVAHACGAGLVVSEMVASEELARSRPDMLRRAMGGGKFNPFVIQLAGREARWMAEGARIARDLGADIVDINMGCPARQVTGGWSGSALMRDLDHAARLIEATVNAVPVPVTLKMRLGWDAGLLNAPELGRRAEALGVAAVTVHGRTRCQFYKGRADWRAIAAVKSAVGIPVIANGDARSLADCKAMLAQSGADAVMIGRGAYGRPWLPGVLAGELDPGEGRGPVGDEERRNIVLAHYEAMISANGDHHGARIARKHVGWYLEAAAEDGLLDRASALRWRAALCREESPARVQAGLAAALAPAQRLAEAA